jgi:predicted acylesterase/phospholipase RssA
MQYDLVFEGGGAKGMVFVGALQEFEARGHSYDRLLGTSAGAITAALLAADYTAAELLDSLTEEEDGQPVFVTFMHTPTDFGDSEVQNSHTLRVLKQLDMPLVANVLEERLDLWLVKAIARYSPGLFSFLERGGWYSAEKFSLWLERKLNEGQFRGEPRQFGGLTLEGFYQATQRELSVVASDTTDGRLLVLNHNTAPNLPVVVAVRMSMNIPLIWPEVRWEKSWGHYLNQDLSGHLIVDGGLLSNFPLELFISDDDLAIKTMGAKTSQNVLGFLIDEAKPVPNMPPLVAEDNSGLNTSELQVVQRLLRLVNTTLGARDKMLIEAFEKDIVRLPAHGYGTTEFGMTAARRDALVEAGRNTMRHHLARQSLTSFSIPTAPQLDPAEHAKHVVHQLLG